MVKAYFHQPKFQASDTFYAKVICVPRHLVLSFFGGNLQFFLLSTDFTCDYLLKRNTYFYDIGSMKGMDNLFTVIFFIIILKIAQTTERWKNCSKVR